MAPELMVISEVPLEPNAATGEPSGAPFTHPVPVYSW